MKKIVFVIESLHLGGAEKSLTTLLQNMDCQKYEVDLILFNEGGLFFDQVPSNVNIIKREIPDLPILNRLYYKFLRKFRGAKFHSAQSFWPLIKNRFIFDKTCYDIAIAYNQGFATYYVSDYIKASKKFAWLNTDYKRVGYNIVFDYPFYKNFDQIITVSPEVKATLKIELEKIEKHLPITVIKDITDKLQVQQLANCNPDVVFLSNKLNIVTVARLAKQKGLYLAVESCKILIDKGYEINWYIVGEGSERKCLQKLIKKKSLKDVFFLLCAKKNPYSYIKKCDIYVQTSLFEGLGLTVIEASYLNKPIVSTNYDTVFAVITDEETGLISEMNPKSIASKIERLVIDEALRTKFSDNLAKEDNKDTEDSLKAIQNLLDN